MYVIRKEYLVSGVNIWRKNGKVGWALEYVKNWKVYKIFVWTEEEAKALFGIEWIPTNQEDLKKLRKDLKEKYEWKKVKVAELYGFEDIDNLFDTIQ